MLIDRSPKAQQMLNPFLWGSGDFTQQYTESPATAREWRWEFQQSPNDPTCPLPRPRLQLQLQLLRASEEGQRRHPRYLDTSKAESRPSWYVPVD